MTDESGANSPASEEKAFVREVTAKAARKLRAQTRRQSRSLVWPGHVRTDRLVRGGANAARRTCSAFGWTTVILEFTFLDIDVAGHRTLS